jgi:deazaflavin-dependent oxidoreductase (nitroreductase family)
MSQHPAIQPDAAPAPEARRAPGQWLDRLAARLEHALDARSMGLAAWLYRRTRGRIARLWHRQVLLLTTRGRRTGRERTVPLQYFPDGDRMVVVAANGGLPAPPAWYFNLLANPRARVEVLDRTLPVRAEELSVDEAIAFWPRVLAAAPDYTRYLRRTSRRLPLLRLVPEAADEGRAPLCPTKH